jgi:hypothetical protein
MVVVVKGELRGVGSMRGLCSPDRFQWQRSSGHFLRYQAAVGHRDHHLAPSRATLRVAFRFRCASAVLSFRPGQRLAVGKLGWCGCATGPEAGVVVDEHPGR